MRKKKSIKDEFTNPTPIDSAAIAKKHGVTKGMVEEIYTYVTNFILEKRKSVNFYGMTDEEFAQTKTTFYIPGIGRYVPRRARMLKKFKMIEESLNKKQHNGKRENTENQSRETAVHGSDADNGQSAEA